MNPFIELVVLILASFLDPIMDAGYIIVSYFPKSWITRIMLGIVWFIAANVILSFINDSHRQADVMALVARFIAGAIIVFIVGYLRREAWNNSAKSEMSEDNEKD